MDEPTVGELVLRLRLEGFRGIGDDFALRREVQSALKALRRENLVAFGANGWYPVARPHSQVAR